MAGELRIGGIRLSCNNGFVEGARNQSQVGSL